MRLIIDPPAAGAWNMAVDETLLEAAAERGVATLRFYGWSEPTLSLGYFQSLGDRVQHAASTACPVVRRASGGGAIVHDRELTYSLALPRLGSAAAGELYDAAHQTLIAALSELGVPASLFRASAGCATKAAAKQEEAFLCFQRRTCLDVVLSEAKIAGSAQRRRRGALLQHGSVLLASSDCAPELPGIQQLTGRRLETAALVNSWLPHLVERLRCRATSEGLTQSERKRCAALVGERFADDDYVARR